MSAVVCCDTCPFSPTCEEEEDLASHSYRDCVHDDPFAASRRDAIDAQTLIDSPGADL